MTRFIEISDNAGKHHLLNVDAIASIEDCRKAVTLRFINPDQKAITLSMSYESFKAALNAGNPIIPGGMIL